MRCFIGVDLGSTTTKAVLMDEHFDVLGRGITNSRSNYDTATRVAKHEALINTRFTLFHRALSALPDLGGKLDQFLGDLERSFRLEQFLDQLADLERTCLENVKGERFKGKERAVGEALAAVFVRLREEAPALFARDAKRKSDFFRDIAGSRFMTVAQEIAKLAGLSYDLLLNVYDKAIIDVENRPPSGEMKDKYLKALERVAASAPEFGGLVGQISGPVRAGARDPARGNLSRRHRLRAGDAALLQGAHPLGDPLPRPGRPHHVSRKRAPCSTSAARTPRRSRSTPSASSRISR